MVKLKRLFAAAAAIALLFCLLPPAGAVTVVDTLRVGLHYGTGAPDDVLIESVDGGGFTAGWYNGRTFTQRASISSAKVKVSVIGASVQVADAATGSVLYTGSDSNLALRPNGGQFKCRDAQYRGDAGFIAMGGRLTVLNYVSLEDYVKGVLPYEMSPSWPLEALKAQAVCARSYALGSLNKHETRYGFDVCNGTDCQVYQGTGRATSNSDSAVDATSGEYLTHKGELATGYFFSSDGGATEDAVNVWGNEVGYLKGVADPYEDLDNAANGRWTKTLTASEVAEKLRSAGYNISAVQSVTITKRTAMDNVNEVTVTDTNGTKATIRRSACRTVFGLNSIRYSINGESGSAPSASPSSSSAAEPAEEPGVVYISGSSALGPMPRFAVGAMGSKTAQARVGASYFAATGNTYTFAGTGWGHNVGMSQYGAKGMAEKGFGYQDILKYYFTNIQITK